MKYQKVLRFILESIKEDVLTIDDAIAMLDEIYPSSTSEQVPSLPWTVPVSPIQPVLGGDNCPKVFYSTGTSQISTKN